MAEEEEGVFGQRVIHRGMGDEALGWEGWLVLIGVGLVAVLVVLFFPGLGLDVSSSARLPPGPEAPPFDPIRLGVGLGLAVLLLGLAAWLIVRTDWGSEEENAVSTSLVLPRRPAH